MTELRIGWFWVGKIIFYVDTQHNMLYNNIMETDKIDKVKCERCDWEWFPRENRLPVKCPNCQCRKWQNYKKGDAEHISVALSKVVEDLKAKRKE